MAGVGPAGSRKHPSVSNPKDLIGSTLVCNMETIKNAHPEPHAGQYLVRRDGWFFVAKVCYGMHPPWWVPSVVDSMGQVRKEAPPLEMKDDDEWCALPH